MCGIFAWVGAGIDDDRLREATGKLKHRGPDAGDYWSDGVAWLGHRRLRIIDLSERGAQPMGNEDGQIQVVFNGEIYNFPELRRELEAAGHLFKSDSDTEVIVHGYEQWGDACVERFWGMFAFAVWDRRNKKLLVARDRFGKKPINYILKDGKFSLASEIPALLATGLSDRRIDLEQLGFFWQTEYIPAPGTGFTDIRKLPAGHAMALENGKLRIWRYYPPREVAKFTGSYDEAKEQLRELLSDATRRRLVSDVPVGIALSGGIDSAIVVAAARKRTSGRLVTVTVRPHVDNHAMDEGDYARATAERYGTEHHEIRPIPDFRESYEQIIRNLGEPFAISSAIPCYYLFKALREHCIVVIGGDGGDELFAGYDLYRYAHTAARLRRLMPGPMPSMAHAVLDTTYGLIPAARPRLKRMMARVDFVRGRPMGDAPWEHRRVLRKDIATLWRRSGPLAAMEAELASMFDETDPMRLEMLTQQFNRMTYHILTKVDITSMAHAVETRAPLLDHRVAEFARSLPNEFLIEGNKGKRILRDLFADELPKSVVGKAKSGFGIPVRELFSNELKGYLTEVLTSPNEAYDALVDRRMIPELIERHAEGKPYQTALLLKLLALRLWIDQTGAKVS